MDSFRIANGGGLLFQRQDVAEAKALELSGNAYGNRYSVYPEGGEFLLVRGILQGVNSPSALAQFMNGKRI